MKKTYTFYSILLIGIFALCLPLNAQSVKEDALNIKKDSLLDKMTNVDRMVKDFTVVDTIGGKAFRRILDSLLIDMHNRDIYRLKRDTSGMLVMPKNNWEPFDQEVSFVDTIIFNPAFLPVVFDGKIISEDLTFLSDNASMVEEPDKRIGKYHIISPDSTFAPTLKKTKAVADLRKFYYRNNPQAVHYNESVLAEAPTVKEAVIQKKSIFDDLLSTEEVIAIARPNMEITKIKRSRWNKEGTHSLQISQNQISDNWNAGGNSNFSVKNYHRIELNYKKDKITFNNLFEWKLVFQKTPADTVRSISITEDYFKVYSVFGLEAYKKWSYSANLQVETPIFSAYKINKYDKIRSLLAPLDVNLGIGMRYVHESVSQKDKYNKLKLSLDLSPISVKFKYIKDQSVINGSTSYGIGADRHTQTDYGSNINLNLNYGFNRYTDFTSRVRYFTNYKKVLVESENRFNLALNRYFSVTIDLYLRFDDEISKEKKDKTFGYWQYNEAILFGLAYKW